MSKLVLIPVILSRCPKQNPFSGICGNLLAVFAETIWRYHENLLAVFMETFWRYLWKPFGGNYGNLLAVFTETAKTVPGLPVVPVLTGTNTLDTFGGTCGNLLAVFTEI